MGREGRDAAEAHEDFTRSADLAFDATEAVVVEGQAGLAVIDGAAHIGALGGGGRFDVGDPREGDGAHQHAGDQQLAQTPQEGVGGAEDVAERDARYDEVRGKRLGVEGEPHEHGAREQARPAPAADRAQRGAAGEQHQQDQRQVDVVIARGGHEGGEDRERQRGAERGEHAEGAAHDQVEQRHAEHADDRLGQQQAEGGEAEELGADRLHPEPSGGLSTVTRPPGSNELKKKLWKEPSIDLTPAE